MASDQADQPPVPGGLEHRQVRGPGHQVVDLHEVDVASVPVHRAGQLRHALLWGRVQTLSAMITWSRRPSSAPASRRSASPYMGEVSTSRMRAAIAASMSSRC